MGKIKVRCEFSCELTVNYVNYSTSLVKVTRALQTWGAQHTIEKIYRKWHYSMSQSQSCCSFQLGKLGFNPMIGEIFGHSQLRSWSLRVQPVTFWHPSVFLYEIGVYSIDSSQIIGDFPAVLNFNRLFLKLNRFICNQLPVLPDHTCGQWDRWYFPWCPLSGRRCIPEFMSSSEVKSCYKDVKVDRQAHPCGPCPIRWASSSLHRTQELVSNHEQIPQAWCSCASDDKKARICTYLKCTRADCDQTVSTISPCTKLSLLSAQPTKHMCFWMPSLCVMHLWKVQVRFTIWRSLYWYFAFQSHV